MEPMTFTSYHVGQLKDAEDWTVFETTRIYDGGMFPKSTSKRAYEHIINRSYANVLCHMLEGNVNYITSGQRVLSGVTVKQADGTDVSVLECPATALEQ